VINYSLKIVVLVIPGIFFVAYFTLLLFSYVTHGINNALFYSFSSYKIDIYLTSLVHIFILNMSFLFINLFCLFSLFKIKTCGVLEDFDQ